MLAVLQFAPYNPRKLREKLATLKKLRLESADLATRIACLEFLSKDMPTPDKDYLKKALQTLVSYWQTKKLIQT